VTLSPWRAAKIASPSSGGSMLTAARAGRADGPLDFKAVGGQVGAGGGGLDGAELPQIGRLALAPPRAVDLHQGLVEGEVRGGERLGQLRGRAAEGKRKAEYPQEPGVVS
jgi:hypothetical protein